MKEQIIQLFERSMESYSIYLRGQIFLSEEKYIEKLNDYYRSIGGLLECAYIIGDIKDEFINLTNKLYEWRKGELEYYESKKYPKRYTFRP